FDKSGNGNRFVGTYIALSNLLPDGAVEPYVFWRRDRNLVAEDGTPGSLQVTTTGMRLAGRVTPALDYGVEVAVQRGSLGSDDVSAWAGHWQVRSALPVPGRLRLLSEYNYASGDADPADGRRGTFDQLYPTPHDKYGLADQVGWKNVHHLRIALDLAPWAPWARWPMNVGYHAWWLAEARDALYTAGGASIARVAAGAGSRHVGQEVDVQLSRMVTPQLQVAAGYAHIVPGKFLEQATPGASYSAPFVMATYIFLADK
ncbi:MAG: alginate export family protein, partial [Vicinamibacterales bacterium]